MQNNLIQFKMHVFRFKYQQLMTLGYGVQFFFCGPLLCLLLEIANDLMF